MGASVGLQCFVHLGSSRSVILAALGISVYPVSHADSIGTLDHRHRLGGYLSNSPAFPSRTRLEGHSHLERGRQRPCVGPRPWSNASGDLLPMSVHSTEPKPPSGGPKTDEKPPASETAAEPDWQPGSKRPYSWHHSPPSESRPEAAQSRSIGVHSILNPTESGSYQTSRPSGLEVPRLLSPSPQQRSSSSPLTHVALPSTQYIQNSRPSLSPGNPPRRIITPVSPAIRYSSVTGKASTAPGKISVSQSPFVQEPSTGVYNVSANVPVHLDPRHSPPAFQAGRSRPPPSSRHSTPTFHHSRHPSSGIATNPSSQESSPTTPQSTYSQFTQPSPSLVSGALQVPGLASSEPQLPFLGMDLLNRTPSRLSAPPHGDEHLPLPGRPDMLGRTPMIPVVIDLKSGSRSQAEKRKANSDASRRFRNRKKNEAALEQRIAELNEHVQALAEERDYYRSERDFFRDNMSQTVGAGQLPARPPSPRHYRSTFTRSGSESVKVEDVSRSAGASPLMTSLPTPSPAHLTSHPSSGSDTSAYGTSTAQGRPHFPGRWPPITTSGDGGAPPYRPHDTRHPGPYYPRS